MLTSTPLCSSNAASVPLAYRPSSFRGFILVLLVGELQCSCFTRRHNLFVPRGTMGRQEIRTQVTLLRVTLWTWWPSMFQRSSLPRAACSINTTAEVTRPTKGNDPGRGCQVAPLVQSNVLATNSRPYKRGGSRKTMATNRTPKVTSNNNE